VPVPPRVSPEADGDEDPFNDDLDKDEQTPKEDEFEIVTEESWTRVNDKAPIWMRCEGLSLFHQGSAYDRDPKDVSDEEYKEFYKAVAKDPKAETLGWAHFKV